MPRAEAGEGGDRERSRSKAASLRERGSVFGLRETLDFEWRGVGGNGICAATVEKAPGIRGTAVGMVIGNYAYMLR